MFMKAKDDGGVVAPTPKSTYGPVTYGGKQVVRCEVFKYVGVWFSSDCTLDVHFEKSLDRATGATYACDGRAMRLDKACPLAVRSTYHDVSGVRVTSLNVLLRGSTCYGQICPAGESAYI